MELFFVTLQYIMCVTEDYLKIDVFNNVIVDLLFLSS